MGRIPAFLVKSKTSTAQTASLTEYSATNAWNLNLSNGNMNNNTKASNRNRVRAVSALLTETRY